MSKRCKGIVVAIGIMIGVILLGFLIKFLCFSGIFTPLLKLKGDSPMQIEVLEEYKDPGVTASFRFQDFSDQVSITSNVNINQLGTYTITYRCDAYDKEVVRKVEVVDRKAPSITLNGNELQRVFVGSTYEDPGYSALDAFEGDLSNSVKVETHVDMSKPGTYEIAYTVSDQSGNESKATRQVEVMEDPTQTKLLYQYDDYNNTAEEWWFNKSKDHQRMDGAKAQELLNQYQSYYLGPDEKVLYLTFDEGGNDITYIKQIAKVLNDNDVKATFFLTRNYIKTEATFMNELVANGHVIGNHSWHHYDMTTLANASGIDQFVQEISETEKTYLEVTGEPMKKVFRFPKGGASERAMKIVSDLGYTNYFWSHAYYDYASDVSKEAALKTLMDHYHNGAIYLLHPSNKGNYEAMDDFIKAMKKLGYRFDTVDHIPQTEKK